MAVKKCLSTSLYYIKCQKRKEFSAESLSSQMGSIYLHACFYRENHMVKCHEIRPSPSENYSSRQSQSQHCCSMLVLLLSFLSIEHKTMLIIKVRVRLAGDLVSQSSLFIFLLLPFSFSLIKLSTEVRTESIYYENS